jgi:hypothetical protein
LLGRQEARTRKMASLEKTAQDAACAAALQKYGFKP